MTLLEIADGAFALMRNRPRTVAGITAVFVLPSQLLAAWLQREALGSFRFDEFDTQTGTFGDQPSGLGAFAAAPIATILPYVVLPFIGVALTHLLLGWRQGHDRSIGACLWFTLRKTPVILAALVLSKLFQVVTLLIATPLVMFVAPVIAAEGLGPIAAIWRSARLGRRRFWPLVGLLLLLALINSVLSAAFGVVPFVAAMLFADWGWIAFFALSSVSSSILSVLAVGAAVVAYLDARNRVEGLDLQRRLHQLVGASAGPAGAPGPGPASGTGLRMGDEAR